MVIVYVLIGLVVLALIAGIAIYNGLVKSKVRVDEAWSDIEVQLKRRYDLIPNLVETVKGYATHEASVFENVTKARSQAMQAGSLKERLADENQLSGALKSLFAVAENYPDLKANANFMQMQNDIRDTEDKIQSSRRFYNGTVRDYNTKLQVFPTNIFASVMGFKIREFFDIDEKGPEGQNVKVQF